MSALIKKGKVALVAMAAAIGLAGTLAAPATASAQTVVVRTGPAYYHGHPPYAYRHYHHHYPRYGYGYGYGHRYHHRDWHGDYRR